MGETNVCVCVCVCVYVCVYDVCIENIRAIAHWPGGKHVSLQNVPH